MSRPVNVGDLDGSVPEYVKERLRYLEEHVRRYPMDLTEQVYEMYDNYPPQKIRELETRATYCDELITRMELMKVEADTSGRFIYQPPEILLNPRHGLSIARYPTEKDIRYWLFDFEMAVRQRYPEVSDIQLCHWVFYWIKNESGLEHECVLLLQNRQQTNWEETKNCLIELESKFKTHHAFEKNVYSNMEKLSHRDPSFLSKLAYYSTLFRAQSRTYPAIRGILTARYVNHPAGKLINVLAARFENEVPHEKRTGKAFIEYVRPAAKKYLKPARPVMYSTLS